MARRTPVPSKTRLPSPSGSPLGLPGELASAASQGLRGGVATGSSEWRGRSIRPGRMPLKPQGQTQAWATSFEDLVLDARCTFTTAPPNCIIVSWALFTSRTSTPRRALGVVLRALSQHILDFHYTVTDERNCEDQASKMGIIHMPASVARNQAPPLMLLGAHTSMP